MPLSKRNFGQQSCGAYSACYALAVMHIVDLDDSTDKNADTFVQNFCTEGSLKNNFTELALRFGADLAIPIESR